MVIAAPWTNLVSPDQRRNTTPQALVGSFPALSSLAQLLTISYATHSPSEFAGAGTVSYRYVCPRCRHSFETPEPRVVQPRCWYCAALMESGPRPMYRDALRRSLLERAKSS